MLTEFALTLERALPGVKLVHLLDDEPGLAGFWPVLTELCERRRLMFVIDNAETVLTEKGQWRDRRWAEATAALTRHSGPSKLLVTSRVRPQGLDTRVRTQQIVLLARELPQLRALMGGKASGMTAADARTLARRVLECAQGHPHALGARRRHSRGSGRASDEAGRCRHCVASGWRPSRRILRHRRASASLEYLTADLARWPWPAIVTKRD